jgi:hypothetical protein
MSEFCFIVIHCHGVIDPKYVIPVPPGKIILKKNLAPCNMIAIRDIRSKPIDTEEGTSLRLENFPTLSLSEKNILRNIEKTKKELVEKDDLNKCMPYEEYRDVCLSAYEDQPIDLALYRCPVNRTCLVLTDKTEYFMRSYSSVNPLTDKIIVMVKNPAIPDRPDGKRKYQDYLQYNLFDPKDTWALLKMYPDWQTDAEKVNNVKRLMSEAYEDPPGWVAPSSSHVSTRTQNPYSYKLFSSELNTSLLFFVISLLPQTIIKMLDASCAHISSSNLSEILDVLNMVDPSYKSIKALPRRGWGWTKAKRSRMKTNQKTRNKGKMGKSKTRKR